MPPAQPERSGAEQESIGFDPEAAAAAQGPAVAAASQDLPQWYRDLFTTMGAGMTLSIAIQVMRANPAEVLLPPRAQVLPEKVVRAWQRNQLVKRGMRQVVRDTFVIGTIASVYFGTEAYVSHMQGKTERNYLSTAFAGLGAGSVAGLLLPGSARIRAAALGALLGGVTGLSAGLVQDYLAPAVEPQP